MKIARNKRYGGPDKVEVVEVPIPAVRPDEIRVRVIYSTVNRTDVAFLRGTPVLIRLGYGILRPRYPALGSEYAGVIDAVGARVSGFALNDRVFGFDDAPRGFGGHAEYKVVRRSSAIAKIPETLPSWMAAASTEGAHYALAFIAKAKVREGDRVFVHGATGAIGSALVQFLVSRGAIVVASSTTEMVEHVRSQGVAWVVDWQQKPLRKHRGAYDFFFDAVGKSSFREARPLLRRGGKYASSELGKYGVNIWLSVLSPIIRLATARGVFFPVPSMTMEVLMTIRHRLETGSFRPLVDREYQLDDIVNAFRYVESGQKKGSVLVRVAQPENAAGPSAV